MIHLIVNHNYRVLFLSILVAIPFLIQVPHIKTVDNVDYFAVENDDDVLFYKELKQIFGNDEFFIIAFKKENLFTAQHLTLLKKLTRELGAIEGVRDVKSLANVEDTIGGEDFFAVKKFLETIPDDPRALNDLKKKALKNPLYLGHMVSRDGKTAGIMVFVHKNPADPGFRKKIINQTRRVLEKYKAQTGKVYTAGWTVTNLVLTQYMKRDLATFIPITYGFITLAVFLFFRNIRLTLVAIVNTSLCMGCTMGLFPIFGITLNNVTTIVPPIIMALALCDTVHIFSHLDHQALGGCPDKRAAYKHVLKGLLKKLIGPCFLTSLTTFVGFLSLYLSDISPIREFALMASGGIVFEFFFAFTFTPAFMLLFAPEKIVSAAGKSPKKIWSPHSLVIRFTAVVFRHFRIIFATGIAVILLSVWQTSNISVETNLLGYFKSKSQVALATQFIETELAGINTLDISFKAKAKNRFKHPESLEIIQALQDAVNRIDGVDKTLSLVDFIKDMHQSFHNENPDFYRIPRKKEMISQYLLIFDSTQIENFVTPSFDHARLSIRVFKHSTRDQAVIIEQINEIINTLDTGDISIRISGLVVQEVNIINALVQGLIYSLTASAVIIILIMFIVLRSVPLGLLGILPNVFPIAVNFGIMGLFHIPLNTATALIATVAICIAVDDTIHFLTAFKTSLAHGLDTREAVRNTLAVKGRPILLSSLILAIGFGVMVFGQFVPTINFGILSCLIMITALAGDMFLLPASALVFLSGPGIKHWSPY